MSTLPIANGRDPVTGQFVAGNQAAKERGNPHAAKVNAWRKSLAGAVTPDDILEVTLKLLEQAKAGEAWAIRELLDRTVGPTGKIDFGGVTDSAIQIVIRPAEEVQRPPRPAVAPVSAVATTLGEIESIPLPNIEATEGGHDGD